MRRRLATVVRLGGAVGAAAVLALVGMSAPAVAQSRAAPLPPISVPVPPLPSVPLLPAALAAIPVVLPPAPTVPAIETPSPTLLGLDLSLLVPAPAGSGPSTAAAGADPTPSPASASGTPSGSAASPSDGPTARRLPPIATGLDAALDTARSGTALFVLVVLAVMFLLVQGRVDRRSPQLADAPIDGRTELLEFS